VTREKGRDLTHLYAQSLSHPLRLLILRFVVKHGQASPSQTSRALGEELSPVSYHTKVLAGNGLLVLASTRSVRGAVEHLYKPVQVALENPVVIALLNPRE
jgi:DNA-binding transcriptional ArsR family regulator